MMTNVRKYKFLDIATGVGFYAVSLPFFDKNNKFLQDNNDGERLRVNILFVVKSRFLININLFLALLHFRAHAS